MAQSTGATSPTVSRILTIDYEPGVQTNIRLSSSIWAAFQRKGSNKATGHRTTQFAIMTQLGNNLRTVGVDDPNTIEYAGAPKHRDVQIGYVKTYGAYRIKYETLREAGSTGAHFDVVKRDLEAVSEEAALHFERQTCQSYGQDVLFVITSAAGAPTYTIEDLGGLDGEEIGVVLESMNLEGMKVHVADVIGAAARDSTAQTIDSIVSTLGAESFTTGSALTSAAAGDYVYRSRSDATNQIQGVSDGIMGLPGLVDDYTRVATFQTVTSTTAPRFKAHVLGNGGSKRDLATTLLQKAISVAKVRRGGVNRDGETAFATHGFVCHQFQEDAFAVTLESDRRYTAPSMFTTKGVKPYAGVEQDMLHYSGIPFFSSQLGLRNTAFLVDFSDVFIVHNGPSEGEFIKVRDSSIVERVTGTVEFEWAWGAMNNLAVRKRNGMVRIDDLTTFTGI
jgi:hypothetical protein